MDVVSLRNIGNRIFSDLIDVNKIKRDVFKNDIINMDYESAYKLYNSYPKEFKIEKHIKRVDYSEIIPDKWYLNNIPKIASFYWGNKELPYLRMLSIVSFHKLNPEWETRLYIPNNNYIGNKTWETNEQNYEIKTKNYFQHFKENYPEIKIIKFDFKSIGIDCNIPESYKSDFIRWHLLSTIGGLWSDIDIQYFKSMNHFSKNHDNFKDIKSFMCFNNNYHSVGFLLSVSKNQLFRDCFESALNHFDDKYYQSAGVGALIHIGLDKVENLKINKVENIEMEVVYPITWNNSNMIFDSNSEYMIKDKTIGLHWFAGNPLAEKCVNELTDKNINKINNTLTNCINKYINNSFNNNFTIITTCKLDDQKDKEFFDKCYNSIINQSYKNYKWIIVNNGEIKLEIIGLPNNIIINNINPKVKLECIYESIKNENLNDDDIIVMIDGDDWLSDNNVLSYINNIYTKEIWLTYGQFQPFSNTYSNYCKPIDTKTYRKNGQWLTSHLKTFRYKLWKNIKIKDLKDENNNFMKGDDDLAFMLPMIEMAGNKHIRFIEKVLYVYNDENPKCGMYHYSKQMQEHNKYIFSKESYKEIDKPTISILITTFNRTNLLKYNLESLSKQNLDNFEYEIIILDEGKQTEEIDNLLLNYNNIKYINTGITKKDNEWRCPSFAINIGLKQAKGDYIILMCAEIYSIDNTIEELIRPLLNGDKYLTIPINAYDDDKTTLNSLDKKENIKINQDKKLNTYIPFIMGMKKEEIIKIGGYDEDFTGIGYDDNDIIERLKLNGNVHLQVNCSAIHLWHERFSYDDNSPVKKRIEYNREIFEKRKGTVTRNESKEWGVLNKTIINVDEKMTMTFTTCKRIDLFEKTIKSFFNNCLDIDLIQDIIVCDDCSSENQLLRIIEILKEIGKPYIIVHKSELNKGHAKSINILWSLIQTDYYFQCEDDWEFIIKDHFIRKALNVMKNDKSIKEFVFRGIDLRQSTQKKITFENIDYIKYNFTEYLKDSQGRPAWLGYSLNPSIQKLSDLKLIGNLNEKADGVELDYAKRFNKAGYKIAYFTNDYCKHIGKDNSSYVLNKTNR